MPGIRSYAALPALGLADRILLRGHGARIDAAIATERREPAPAGEVALVLGAGNVTATPVLDVLDQIFRHGRSVLLKPSPLHDTLTDHFTAALRPLVAADLLAIHRGDGATGKALAHRDEIASVHLTGSSATWAELHGDPALAGKALSAEVGCCTPALVVPGQWRDRELRAAAEQIAAYVAMNGGATCLAPRLLVSARRWPQRRAFLERLRHALATLPARLPFHPGSRQAYALAAGVEPRADGLQPILRADLDRARDAALWSGELFAPVLLEIALDADDTPRWLEQATAFVGGEVFGALSAYLFAPARRHGIDEAAIERAIARLPHGTIAINCWTGLGYGLGNTPWGVPPDTPWQCGHGFVRGPSGLCPLRTVVRGPLRPHPLPPWLPSHRRGAPTLRALTHFLLAPSPTGLAKVVALALQQP
ncbi:MAG: aldehyde dehydrogenase [Planctomycetes bacterium]|nr:aldehyde dehydrogenase [Planctomycetota bacterium]